MLAPPNYGSGSGFACLIDKHKRLASQNLPKIVLVGGSNVALGMDSSKLEYLMHKPVVNMGFGCTVGLRYMLEEIKDSIRNGDLVVIMPEYDFFIQTTRTESNARVNGSCELLNLVQVYPYSIKWVASNYIGSFEKLNDFLNDSHQLIADKIQFYRKVLHKCRSARKIEDLKGLFALAPNPYNHREAYDKHGDVTIHLDKPSPGLNGMEVINYMTYKFNDESANLVAGFGKFASEKGVTVVVLPAPLPERIYKKYGWRADDIFKHLRTLKYIKTLSTPEDFVFPESKFFDTAYHLTAEGRAERTQKVFNELRAANLAGNLVK